MAPTPQEIPDLWSYPLTEVTENKRTNRTGVPKDSAYELVGAAGDIEGGVSPFHGFKMLHRLNFQADPNHNTTSRVTEHFSCHLTVAYDGYIYGFVYRAVRPADTTTADIFIDYWNSKTAAWVEGTKLVDGISATAVWKYEGSGRIGYVFVRGRSPVRFYIERDTPYAIQVLGTTSGGPFPGPGARPTCAPVTTGGLMPGAVDWTDSELRPGYGQVFLLATYPSTLQQFYFSGLASGSGGGSGSGVCNGAPGYPFGSATRAFPPGAYAYAYQLLDSRTGLKSAISDIGWANTADWGAYSSAWMVLEVAYDSSKFDQMIVYRSVRLESGGGAFAGSVLFIDAIIDLSDYWTCKVRPGGPFDPAATDFRHVMYMYALEDKQLVNQPEYLDDMLFDERMPFGGEAVHYQGTMIVSRISTTDPSTSVQNRPYDPTISNGEMRWSSLTEPLPELFSPYSRLIPSVPSSDAVAIRKVAGHAIGLGKDRQFMFRKAGTDLQVEEIHEGYGVVGPKALDSFGSVLYFLTPKGLKAVDTNSQLDSVRGLDSQIIEGWSLTSLEGVSVAVDPVASCMFVHNPTYGHTMVVWFNTPGLTEVLDNWATEVRRSIWPSDPATASSTLVERATFLWNAPTPNTGVGATFKPMILAMDYGRTKVIASSGTVGFNGQPRVTMLDFDGDTRLTVGATAYAGFSSGTSLSIKTVTGQALPTPAYKLVGAKLYVLWSATASLIGKSATIVDVNSTAPAAGSVGQVILSTADAAQLYGLADGDRVGVSPVYFRWVGHQIQIQPNDQRVTPYADFFRVKQVENMRAAFSDVTGSPLFSSTAPATLKDAVYRGLVYRGNEDSALAKVIPSSAADGSPVQSVLDGEGRNAATFQVSGSTMGTHLGVVGSSLTPGLEIFCPDLFFKLLGVRVKGKILGTDRSQQAS